MDYRRFFVVVFLFFAAATVVPAMAACFQPPAGLAAWWGGDGNPGDVFGAWDGTVVGTAGYGEGRVGSAFAFDGSGARVDVANAQAGVLGSAPFTIAFWMNAAGEGSAEYIIGRSHPDGGVGWDIRYQDGKIALVGFNGWAVNLQTTPVIVIGQWHHVALVSDGSTVELYLDGATIPAWSIPRQNIPAATNPLRFGASTNFGGAAFNGRLDEIQFFGTALDGAAIQSIFAAGAEGVCRPCAALPGESLGWWRGEDSANDAVGGFDGTNNGASFVEGIVGQAFSFDGVDDFVELPDSEAWDFGTGSFTLATWVRSPGVGGSHRQILAYHTGGGSGGLWTLTLYNSGLPHLDIHTDAAGSIAVEGSSRIDDGQWHHIAGVRDAAAGELRLYVDGELATDPVSDREADIVGLPGTRLVLGAGGWADGGIFQPFTGEIDEVTIVNAALSATKIRVLVNARASGVCTSCTQAPAGMVSWWPGSGAGNDLYGGNDGTPVNGATYAPGLVEQAFGLEGVNDYIEVPHDDSLSFAPTDPMTIDFWAKRTGGSTVAQHLFGKRPACGGGFNYQIAMDLLVKNGVCFAGDSGSSISVCSTGGIDDLPLGRWTHIAFTFDGATGRLYLDGNQVASAAGTLGTENTSTVRIGTSGDCGGPGIGYEFHGLLDEVEIHDRVLGRDEIYGVYSAGANGKCNFNLMFGDGFESGVMNQ